MMPTVVQRPGRSLRAPARSLAVALVLSGGVVATVATSPAPEDLCPASPGVSEFFGEQDEDRGGVSWPASGEPFDVGPFWGNVTDVHVASCVVEHTDDDGLTTVVVTADVIDDGSSPGTDLESFLRAAVLVDGRGRAHTVADLTTGESGYRHDDLPAREASLVFALPLDVPEPVVLRVPNLDGRSEAQGGLTVPLRAGSGTEAP